MKSSLALIATALAVITSLVGCTPVSIQTTQYIQNGDRFTNENKFDQAQAAYRQYLKLGPGLGIYRNELLEAETHRKLAYVYAAKAKYDSSLLHLRLALNQDLKFPDNQANLLSDVTELALLNAYKGNYRHALQEVDFYIDSLKVSVRKNADRQAYANLLLAKARIEFTLGEYQRSELALTECLKLIDPYPFDVEKAEVKYLLGLLYKDQGRVAESSAHLSAATSMLKKAGLNYSLQLHAQGDQLFLQGLLELGIARHQEALQAAESSNIVPLIIRSHNYLGEAYEFIGDRKQADFHFLKAIELQRKLLELGYQENPMTKPGNAASLLRQYQQTGQKAGIAKASVGLADYYKTKGRPDSSLFYLKQAASFYAQNDQQAPYKKIELKLIDVYLDKGEPDSARLLLEKWNTPTPTYELAYLKGRYAVLVGREAEAKIHLRDALTRIEETRSGFSIPSLRSNYLGNKNYVYEAYIDLLLKSPAVDSTDAQEAYDWNERARSRNFLDIVSAKKITPLSPAHKPVLEKELVNRLKLIKLTEEIETHQLSDDLLNEYRNTKSLHQVLTDSIARLQPQYSVLLTSHISSLPDIQAALNPDELLIQYWIGTQHSYLWYVSRNTFGIRTLNVKEAELEREITAFRNALKFKLQDEIATQSRKLFTRLLAPIPVLAAYPNLIIVPHRSQNFIPFETLQAANGDYLIQTHTLSYAPSGTIFRAKRMQHLELTSNMLAMALGEEVFENYKPLPGTIVEVQNIARYFNPTQIKIGPSSTESTLKSASTDFGLIHLATHGVLNKQNPLQSFIVLKADSVNDGRLTVSEILDMKLVSSLTTLSACETALGEVNRGNELTGLSTAFLYCGSKAVIVSLWQVDDQATAALMSSFYAELSKGISISKALALAQRKLLAMPEYSGNPFYWSPFIIIGDGRQAAF